MCTADRSKLTCAQVSTPTQPLKGVPIPDDPPVAAIDDGGPIQPVTRYTQPVDFAYEVGSLV